MNTVSQLLSGADRVLPSVAGWEKIPPRQGVFSHEAYCFPSRIARRARSGRRGLVQDVVMNETALALTLSGDGGR